MYSAFSSFRLPFGPAHFRNISAYPAANNPTQLTRKQIHEFNSEYHIPRGVYYLYMPQSHDRIYHMPVVPEGYDGRAIGISESAFKCGFGVPLLKLVRRLFVRMSVAFSQMDPNGFIHMTPSSTDGDLVKLALPKVPLSDSRDMDWLFALWGSGNTSLYLDLHSFKYALCFYCCRFFYIFPVSDLCLLCLFCSVFSSRCY